MAESKYSFELWSRSGQLLADLSGRAKNRRVIRSRNEAEQIFWQVDLNDFRAFASASKTTISALLVPGQTEIRVRRGLNYICGGTLTYRNLAVTPVSQDIELRGDGFLNLFDDRYTAEEVTFTATEATTIASTVINTSQAIGSDWDYGVTIGLLATVGPHDRTYQAENIKNLLQNLTNVQTNPFDFEFTASKVFNTYAHLGSNRPEIVFSYPGNIKSYISPKDATGLANHIRAYGAGAGGAAATTTTADDTNSQHDYRVHEKKVVESSVSTLGDLTDHANSELAAWAQPFEVPQIVVDGNVTPVVTDYSLGDYVTVELPDLDTGQPVRALYRIEKIDLKIDENDNEEVTLYLAR